MRRTKIFSGSSHQDLTFMICERLGHPITQAKFRKFANKEVSVDLGVSVRNEDVFIVQSGSDTVNDHLMELLVLISACKSSSARRITAVMPYFPYSKQSKKKKQRGTITAKLVANMITAAGADHVITMDLHAAQMQGFFSRPVDNLYAEPTIAKWIQENIPDWQNAVVVSKNAGGARRVISLADRLQIDFAIVHTDRRPVGHTPCATPTPVALHRRASSENHIISGSPLPLSSRSSRGLTKSGSYTQIATSLSHVPHSVHLQSPLLHHHHQYHLHHSNHHGSGMHSPYLPPIAKLDSDANSPQISATPSVYEDSESEEEAMPMVSEMELQEKSNYTADKGNGERITLIGNVTDKIAFIVDDMIDGCHSFIEAACHLRDKCGASKVYLIATHAILSGDSVKEIEECPAVDALVVTNCYPISAEKKAQSSKLKVIDISGVLAEAIRRTHNGESISYLFHTCVF